MGQHDLHQRGTASRRGRVVGGVDRHATGGSHRLGGEALERGIRPPCGPPELTFYPPSVPLSADPKPLGKTRPPAPLRPPRSLVFPSRRPSARRSQTTGKSATACRSLPLSLVVVARRMCRL